MICAALLATVAPLVLVNAAKIARSNNFVELSSVNPNADSTTKFNSVPSFAQKSSTVDFAFKPAINAVAKASSGSGSSSDVLPDKSMILVAPIQLGSQKSHIDVILDTGSNVFWVSAVGCNGCISPQYDTKKSSTAKTSGNHNAVLKYGDNTVVECAFWNDTLALGDITVSTEGVCVATKYTPGSEVAHDFTGILGIGSSLEKSTNLANAPASILAGFSEKKISFYYDRSVLVNLARNQTGKAGEVTFGTPDSTRFTGDIHWSKITKANSFWEVPITSVEVGTFKHTYDSAQTIILDSGTSLIYLDQDVADAVNTALGFASAGDGFYTIDCSKLASNNSRTSFSIGSVKATLSTIALTVYSWPGRTEIHISLDYNAQAVGFAISTDAWIGQGIPGIDVTSAPPGPEFAGRRLQPTTLPKTNGAFAATEPIASMLASCLITTAAVLLLF
eukprot:jgi/Hompol1/1591/HPOL_005652-RA